MRQSVGRKSLSKPGWVAARDGNGWKNFHQFKYVIGHQLFQHNSWPAGRNCCFVLVVKTCTTMSPTAETEFCCLSVDRAMWTFSSWKWQERRMSEKSVPRYRRPCLSSTCVTKCSNHCAAILNLFSSAVNRFDFLPSRKRKWSACSKWLPERLREDKNYCVCLSQQKVPENTWTVCTDWLRG